MPKEIEETKHEPISELQDYLVRLKNNDPTLTSIKFEPWHKLEDGYVEALAEALKVNNTVTSIRINSDHFDPSLKNRDVEVLAEALKVNKTVIFVHLESRRISNRGAAALAEALKVNNTIRSVYLDSDQIGEAEVEVFIEALETNTTITSLHLSNYESNYISDEAFEQIDAYLWRNNEPNRRVDLKNSLVKLRNNDPKLTYITLDLDIINDEEILEIAETIKGNSNLTRVYWENRSSSSHEEILAQIESYVERNNEPDRQAKLQSFLTKLRDNNPSLTKIGLNLGKITDEEAREIMKAIKANNTLISIDLNSNNITEALPIALAEALEVNTTLTEVKLQGRELANNLYLHNIDKSILYIDKSILSQIRTRLGHNKTMAKLQNYLLKLRSNDPTLTSIELSGNTITDREIEVLAEALKVNNSVTSVNFESNKITDIGLIALADALKVNNTITSVVLHSEITDTGLIAFAEALKVNNSLTSLHLPKHSSTINKEILLQIKECIERNNELDRSKRLQYFLTKLRSNDPALTEISLSLNRVNSYDRKIKIPNEEMIAIVEAIKINKTLTKIDLSNNQINDEDAKLIAEAIKINKTLTSINLSDNLITNSGARELAEACKINETLTNCDLDRFGVFSFSTEISIELNEEIKEINKKIVKQIKGYMKRNKETAQLEKSMKMIRSSISPIRNNVIDFSWTEITAEVLKELAEALKVNRTVTHIALQINDEGAETIADAIKVNTTLTSISLKSAQITDDGAKAIVTALESNTTLLNFDWVSIDMGRNIITQEVLLQIEAKLERNRVIAESIPKIITEKAIIKEVSDSDVEASLPPVLQELTMQWDDRVMEGKEAEDFLKKEKVYDTYFDQDGLLKTPFIKSYDKNKTGYKNSNLSSSSSSSSSSSNSNFNQSFSSSSLYFNHETERKIHYDEYDDVEEKGPVAFHVRNLNTDRFEFETYPESETNSVEADADDDIQQAIQESFEANRITETKSTPNGGDSSRSLFANGPLSSPKNPNAASLTKDTDRSK